MTAAPMPDGAELLEAWGAYMLDQGYRPATRDGYLRVGRMWLDHLARLDPPVAWFEAGPAELRGFLDAPPANLASSHRRRGPDLSPASRVMYDKTIRRMLAFAVDEEWLDRDPLRRMRRPREPDPLARALDPEQVGLVLQQVAGDPRLELAVQLGYFAGLRIGEVCRLRVEDLRLTGRRPTALIHGKAGKNRVVPVTEHLREVLETYLAGPPRRTRGPLLEAYRSTWADRRIPTGRPLAPKHLGQRVREAMDAAGIGESHHAFRHSFATTLIEASNGAGLLVVSRILGHASTKTTEKYYIGSASLDAARIVELLPDPGAAS
jgi:integrase/recombinase XerD